ncbi:Glycosyl transferase group 1 [Vibrio crassostreae]|nr:Glycosyl transferase group 1 [Vibrio crassostreae]CAK2235533.1 Glycosyl transferase group 1 [Vibrio crassostreae]CAK2386763.1 Glycosyl transferase group 1 [Vibrio crassostreae]CAK4002189.1 Glycosyl transferase group 1 [Vibrio crassostreae]
MKVLHITNAYPYEGHPEYGCFIYEQINSLDKRIDSEVYFINAHKLGTLEYFKSIPKIREMAKESDVIHCHHLFSFIALKLSFAKRKPVVLSFLNDWTKEVKLNIPERLKHLLCFFYSRKPEKVIFKSFIPDFLNSDKYLFLPNGVDTAYFDIQDKNLSKDKLSLCKESNYILFVSSKNLYRHQKRYDIFLKVMEYLNSNYPEMNYLPLTMSVDDRETAKNKINSSSLHLLCSDYEGSPNSVKEALSSGVPVVSRPAGSVEDLLNGTPFTALVDSDDHIKIANEIHKILTLDIDRVKIREALLKKNLSKEQVAGQLHNTYSSLISVEH